MSIYNKAKKHFYDLEERLRIAYSRVLEQK